MASQSHALFSKYPAHAVFASFVSKIGLFVCFMGKDTETRSSAGEPPESIALAELDINDKEESGSGTVSPAKNVGVEVVEAPESSGHESDGAEDEANYIYDDEQQEYDENEQQEEDDDEQQENEATEGERFVDPDWAEEPTWTKEEQEQDLAIMAAVQPPKILDINHPDFWKTPGYVAPPEIIWPPTGYTLVDTEESLVALLDTIEQLVDKVLWMDLEGDNLGRNGTISILQLFIDAAAQRRFVEHDIQFAQAIQDAEADKAAEEAEAKAKAEEEARATAEGRPYPTPPINLRRPLPDKFAEQKKKNDESNRHPPTDGHIYLVDITVLRDRAFSTPSSSSQLTLRRLLESHDVPKVLWDCRSDSDALYPHYGISLASVLDLQLLECYGRRSGDRRQRISGYAGCLTSKLWDTHAETEYWNAIRAKGFFKRNGIDDYSVFDRRPLSQELIEYCVGDVKYMPFLWGRYSNMLIKHEEWPYGPRPVQFCTLRPAEYFEQPVRTRAWQVVRQSANRVKLSQYDLWDRDLQGRSGMTLSPWQSEEREYEDVSR